MKFFNVKKAEQVRELLFNISSKYEIGSEKVNLTEAEGRVISENILATKNVPEFNRSTVDGYALKSENSIGASEGIPIVLNVVGKVSMGKMFFGEIYSGEAVYVPTGGMIPKGTDAMIMIEDTEELDDTIFIYKSVAVGSHIVYTGEDLTIDSIVLEKYKCLTTNDIGILAALGIWEVSVMKKPTITIISTGDEIVDVDAPMEIGQVRDINRYVLMAIVKKIGGIVNKHFIIGDDYEDLKNGIVSSFASSDIVFLSGGSSVGSRDYTNDVLEELGEILVHGIAIKPGKPTIIGMVNNKIVVGLPGHPLSSITVFKVFFEKFILDLLKQEKKYFSQKVILGANVHGSPGKETYQLIQLIEEHENLVAMPIYSKSGFISTLAKAHGYFVIDRETEGIKQGCFIDVVSLY